MDRLNCFAYFESKKVHHEDALTRALLVVLRLIPEAHRRFLVVVGRHRTRLRPSLPLPSSWTEHPPAFKTQTGRVQYDARHVLSLLLTDAGFPEPIVVEESDRGARYDGIIAYPPDWVFVIENKPHHDHVWREQLSVNLKAGQCNGKVEDVAVVVQWQELVGELSTLLGEEAMSDTATTLLKDFLDYVHEVFPFLNPYRKISICRDSLHLLNSRCRDIMKEITPDRVHYHRGWKDYMSFTGAACQVAFDAQQDAAGPWELVLSLHPGDTVKQARLLYERLDIIKLLALSEAGWEVDTNFHLAHMQQNLVKLRPRMPVQEYADYWCQRQRKGSIKQIEIADEGLFAKIVKAWQALGLISEEDVEKIDSVFTKTNRKKINVCPGVTLKYRWSTKVGEDLDERGALAGAVKEKVEEAFAVWGQRFFP